MNKKPGRNDPCPCGSGIKFKKCCEKKMIKGKFLASTIDNQSQNLKNKASGLSSFFQQKLSQSTSFSLSNRQISAIKGPIKKEPPPIEEEKTPDKPEEDLPENS